MGASKQLSTDLKTKIINYYELGEGYKKLSGRFGLSISTVRNVVQKWKATGTVLVKERCGRPKKIQERHRRRMVRMVTDKPQLAADGVVVHRSTIQCTLHQEKLIGRVMRKKLCSSQEESHEIWKSSSGQARSILEKNTVVR